MITLRKSSERGHLDHGWLDTYHTFSFGNYHDPDQMGFGPLRVINEDRVQGGRGFGTHPHRDMEIVTYVIEGALQHQDSFGNGSVMRPGDVQRMSAGTGVLHSEFNASPSEPVHLLQIWIEPQRTGLPPSYEQKTFAATEKRGRWRPLVSPQGEEGALQIHQDAALFAALLKPGETLDRELIPGRRAWLQVVRGAVSVNGQAAGAGDGLAIFAEPLLGVRAGTESELLLFDLP